MVKFKQKVTKNMSFKQKAKQDMRNGLKYIENTWGKDIKPRQVIHHLIDYMRKLGWDITQETLFDTARHLGFTVVGICIYDEGD